MQVFLMLACESAVGIELCKGRHIAAVALKKVFKQVLHRAGLSDESLKMFDDRVQLLNRDFVEETNLIRDSTVILFNNLKGFDEHDRTRGGT